VPFGTKSRWDLHWVFCSSNDYKNYKLNPYLMADTACRACHPMMIRLEINSFHAVPCEFQSLYHPRWQNSITVLFKMVVSQVVVQNYINAKGLPKKTQSLCPECKKVIDARIFEEDGKAIMEKTCDEHGYFRDVVWSDAKMYLRAENYAYDGIGVTNPKYPDAQRCPDACGLCNLHYSHTSLANVDLTNRCNLSCPICFANANAAGYVYEPSFEEIVKMLQTLRDSKPVPVAGVQFSGGEPTVYPRVIEVIRKAKEMDFAQIQLATNGIKLAQSKEFVQDLVDAGLSSVYLQFDGLDPDIYVRSRGRNILPEKLKAIENCRNVTPPKFEGRVVENTCLSTILVPTIVKGLNDHQVGDIVRFAMDNIDVVRGINFQPVAFTGRMEQEEREEGRYTLSDLASDLESQTGWFRKDDFYPVPCVAPISRLVSQMHKRPKIAFTAHPHCGLATYAFVDENGLTPITRFMDVDAFFEDVWEITEERAAGGARTKIKGAIGSIAMKSDTFKKMVLKKGIDKYFDFNRTPASFERKNVHHLLEAVFTGGDKNALADFAWSTLFIGGMHFQDLYNYDIERLKRCAIHYATPDGRIIPFCAYNGGPYYREQVEKKFSVPLDEWRKREEQSSDGRSSPEDSIRHSGQNSDGRMSAKDSARRNAGEGAT